MVVGLIILGVITVGVETNIDKSLVRSSDLLGASLLGWQLIYILPVAILTNDFFISGFWMRTFASKTDKDLIIGTSIATVAVAIILTLVGTSGFSPPGPEHGLEIRRRKVASPSSYFSSNYPPGWSVLSS